jgi:hypothetical protein
MEMSKGYRVTIDIGGLTMKGIIKKFEEDMWGKIVKIEECEIEDE